MLPRAIQFWSKLFRQFHDSALEIPSRTFEATVSGARSIVAWYRMPVKQLPEDAQDLSSSGSACSANIVIGCLPATEMRN